MNKKKTAVKKKATSKKPVGQKLRLPLDVLTLFKTWDHMGDMAQHEEYQLTFDVLNKAVTAIAKKMKLSRSNLIDLYHENLNRGN